MIYEYFNAYFRHNCKLYSQLLEKVHIFYICIMNVKTRDYHNVLLEVFNWENERVLFKKNLAQLDIYFTKKLITMHLSLPIVEYRVH